MVEVCSEELPLKAVHNKLDFEKYLINTMELCKNIIWQIITLLQNNKLFMTTNAEKAEHNIFKLTTTKMFTGKYYVSCPIKQLFGTLVNKEYRTTNTINAYPG